MKRSIAAFLLVIVFVAPSSHAAPTLAPALVTFTVNSKLDQLDDDTNDGVCHTAANTCTLRAAVMQADTISGAGAAIIVPSGVYTLTRPILGGNGADSGDLNLTTPASGAPLITISGVGAASTIIDGNQLDRVFRVDAGRTATISRVTIRNGYSSDAGGAIYNAGTLNVSYSTISANYANFSGGGIYNIADATLNVSYSTISANHVNGGGGGIYNIPFGTLNVSYSTISSNHAHAGSGGGIRNQGLLYLTNSTINLNDADQNGGGIYNFNTSNVYNSTIFFNQADADVDFIGEAGGVYNQGGSTFNLRNTLLAGNYVSGAPAYDECAGVLTSLGRNLIGTDAESASCTVSIGDGNWSYLNSLAGIGPLKNNGGPTWTQALLPGSNAIDGGDPSSGCLDQNALLLATDQRGAARVVGVRCDIGAFEYRPPVYVPLIRR